MGSDLVLLMTFANQIDASVCKTLLDSHGISSCLFDEHTASNFEYSVAVGYIKLMVPREESERALEILIENEVISAPEKGDNITVDPCVKCGSLKISKNKLSLPFYFISFPFAFLPVLLRKRTYRCDSCHYSWKSKIMFHHIFFSFWLAVIGLIVWVYIISSIKWNK
jgi:hypothetical protein